MKYTLKLGVVALLLTLSNNTYSQKDYVWCPDEVSVAADPTTFQNKRVTLVVHDSRVLSTKGKQKCTSREIQEAVASVVRSSCPNAVFVDDSSEVKIEIWIKSYSAIFTSPVWYAKTAVSVRVDVGGKIGEVRDFQVDNKFFNVGGFTTAKNNLNKSYKSVVSELIAYILTKQG